MYNKESLEAELPAQPGVEGKAPKIDLADFSTAISAGVLRALDARSTAGTGSTSRFRPWIWAGFIMGPEGPEGPFGPGGPGGPGSPGQGGSGG
jgi:hypothetical protein